MFICGGSSLFFLVIRYKSAETLANRLYNKNKTCISYHKWKRTSVTALLEPYVQASSVLQHLCSRRTSGEEHLESSSLQTLMSVQTLNVTKWNRNAETSHITARLFSNALNTCRQSWVTAWMAAAAILQFEESPLMKAETHSREDEAETNPCGVLSVRCVSKRCAGGLTYTELQRFVVFSSFSIFIWKHKASTDKLTLCFNQQRLFKVIEMLISQNSFKAWPDLCDARLDGFWASKWDI